MNSVPEQVKQKGFSGVRGDPSKAPRCGAKTRNGTPCKRPAERNPKTGKRSRCRLHGGLSSGPKTPEGKSRISSLHFRHGRFSNAAREAKAELKRRLEHLKATREEVGE